MVLDTKPTPDKEHLIDVNFRFLTALALLLPVIAHILVDLTWGIRLATRRNAHEPHEWGTFGWTG